MILDPSIQRHLTHFNLITHGFGNPAMIASLNSFMNVVTEMIKYLEKHFGPNGQMNSGASMDSKTNKDKVENGN